VSDVYSRQDKIMEGRKMLEGLLARGHIEAKKAWDLGANENQMKDILIDIRRAQWRWDFASAGHGNSFHSPVESGRIISAGIVFAQDARVRLARLLASLRYNDEVPYPDLSTKAKAQDYIGLDMKNAYQEKKKFLNIVVPQWIEEGKEREKGYQNP
jgi:nitrite reductase (cytochrome c-552)